MPAVMRRMSQLSELRFLMVVASASSRSAAWAFSAFDKVAMSSWDFMMGRFGSSRVR